MMPRMVEQDAHQCLQGRDVRIPPDPKGSGFSLFELK
ncbi:hypothetical protein HACA111877_18020 [Halomonas casei]